MPPTIHALTLAATSEQLILRRVQDALNAVLATGRNVSATPQTIREILQAAGCDPKNPQYPEMVLRTNMMAQYNDANEATFASAPGFNVWRYDGIEDGREGDDHRPHFGKYYPANVRFNDVRGPRVYNCRCVKTPIYYKEWQRLKAAGARIADGYSESFISAPQRVPLPIPPDLQAALPPELEQARTLPDLLQTPEGRQWARANKEELRAGLLGPKITAPELPATLPIPEPKIKLPKTAKDIADAAYEKYLNIQKTATKPEEVQKAWEDFQKELDNADIKSTLSGYQFRTPVPEPSPHTVGLPSGQRIEFIRHEVGPRDKMVWVDVRKLDAAWENDSDYLPPGSGGASEVVGRRAGFAEFLATGRPVQAPRIGLDPQGNVFFTDGRHRFSVLRDRGLTRIPVMVRPNQAAKIEALLA